MKLFKKQTTVYVGEKGERVTKETPNAKKQIIQSKKWYGGIKIKGRWKHIPLYTDKVSSQQKLSELIKDEERGETGLKDSITKARCIEIDVHLNDYMDYLNLKKYSKEHLKNKKAF